MRVAIVGSRNFPDLERVTEYVRGLPLGASLVTGSASGVDATAIRAARARDLPVLAFRASFEEAHDVASGVERNQRLIDACDVLVAFWEGTSRGTRQTVERALDRGREVHVFTVRRPGAGADGPHRGRIVG